ncbi:MAG: helix-turn-helix domain-containing protein [Elusimicrobia bacterium]|nr:helix-turn-helix domain-containing protein [Elusimicrobiota bacterium]
MAQEGKREYKEVMDIKGLSGYLGIGKSKIYSLIRQRKIPASRIGRQYRFSKEVIDSWLRESLITAPQEPQIPLFDERHKPARGSEL